MFGCIFNFIKSIDIYYKSAFSAYPFSAILAIIGGLLLSIYIFLDGNNRELVRFLLLNLFLVFMALNLESIRFLQSQKLRYLFIFSLLIISAILVYKYILILDFKDNIFLIKYNALLLSLIALFVSLNLRYNFRSFFDFIASAFLALSFFILFAILIFISFLSIDFLFSFNFNIFRIYSSSSVCIATIFFIFFIGKVALKNHFLFVESQTTHPTPKSKKTKNLFLIFSIFSYFYAAILLLYFLLLFLGFIYPQYSAVHLIIWFSFFGITLFWLNQALSQKYLGRFFLALLLVLNIIVCYSILVRINEYGFTPSRYFVLVSYIFLFISIISSFVGRNYLKILFYFFAILCIVSAFGSFNAIKISIDSQLERLKNLELISKNYERIKNIYYFLEDYLEEEKLAEYKRFLDTNNRHNYNFEHLEYYNIPEVLDVRGFDTFIDHIKLNKATKFIQKGGVSFALNDDSLEISKGEVRFKIDNLYDFMTNGNVEGYKTFTIELKDGKSKAILYIGSFLYDEKQKRVISLSCDALLKIDSSRAKK